MDMRELGIAGALVLSLGVAGVLAAMSALGQVSPLLAQSAIRYVATTGADAGSCTDPAHPCATVQYAVDQAAEGDEVRIATGVYTDVHQRAGITQTVYISKTVTLRGGYDAAFTDPPDPDAYPTTLDARGRGRVLDIIGTISPTVEGLRITGGNAIGLGGNLGRPRDAGGGVYILTATTVLHHNQVFSNTAYSGGGVYLEKSSGATLYSNSIHTNVAHNGMGGGVYLWGSNAVTISDNAIATNTADYGGGLGLDGDTATLNGNLISGNIARYHGGGLYSVLGPVTFDGNTFSTNTAGDRGGGVYLVYSFAPFSNNTVTANAASRGGGLFLFHHSTLALTNNFVADNQASVGGGLYISRSSPHLQHTTVSHNGGWCGIYVTDDQLGSSSAFLTNTVLISHTIGIYVVRDNAATLEATLWGAGAWANGTDWAGAGTIITGTRNVWGDPAFVNPIAGDYHLGPTSAAIDAGVDVSVHTDIDGEPRPYRFPDLGADEYWPPGVLKRLYLPLVFRGA